MLTVAECRVYLDDRISSDEEILAIRDALYSISGRVISKYYDTMGICQNEHLFTAESPQFSKERQGTVLRGKNTAVERIASPRGTK